jgi:hypothetical protein
MMKGILVGLMFATLALGVTVSAQDTAAYTRAQLSTMLTAASGTPQGKGVLTTALADAKTAAIEAAAAERASNDLLAMRLRAGIVLAALDPALSKTVTGTYGVRPAVQAVVQQLTLLRAADTKADAVRMVPAALTAAQNALRWCDGAIDLAQRMQSAQTAKEASALAPQLTTLIRQLAAGTNTSTEPHPIPSAADGGLLYVQLQMQMLKVGRDAVAAAPPPNLAPQPRVQERPRPLIPSVSTVDPATAVSR